MNNFIWNINLLGFWRLAWLKKGFKCHSGDGWSQHGRFAVSSQWRPFYYMAHYWLHLV